MNNRNLLLNLITVLLAITTMFSLFGKEEKNFLGAEQFSTLSEALKAAKGKTLVISQPLKMVNSHNIVTEDTSLLFTKKGIIVGKESSTLEIKGVLTAPFMQIFSGNTKVRFKSNSVTEVYPQWWGAKGDGKTDDTAAVQAAIDSQICSIKLPQGKYLITKPLNFTNLSGIILQGVGDNSKLIGCTGDIVIDTAGSKELNFRDFTIVSGKNNPSTIGILYARSEKCKFVEFNSLTNININIASNPEANNGNGTVAIYNYASEIWRGRDLYLQADNAVVFTGFNIFKIKSYYVEKIKQYASMSCVTIDGASTLRGRKGPCVTLDNATRVEILNAYYCGSRKVKDAFPYAIKAASFWTFSLTITGHKERAGGWLYVDGHIRNLKLEGTAMGKENKPAVYILPKRSISFGNISLDPLVSKEMVLLEAGANAAVKNFTIDLYQKQKITAPKARFCGNTVRVLQSMKDTVSTIQVSPKASYILMAEDGIMIKGEKK
jgi:hypothetical protein